MRLSPSCGINRFSDFVSARLAATFIIVSSCAGLSRADSVGVRFPTKPIKIVVYMKPGGLIDVTARRFATIASKYTDATFVVENKFGAGGIVAMQKVQRQRADGYTLYACTKSNISKVVSCNAEPYLANFHWLALLMADPECVITHKKSNVATWDQLVADAKSRPGEQLWLGPAKGGLDHVTAMKIWEKSGITAKWIPFSSGGEARGRLIGRHGAAYVGNPGEVLGNSDLMIAAISSARRLSQFPDAPTFRELGIEGLDDEVMWRGLALKKGTPRAVIEWYETICEEVSQDQEWREAWKKGGIDVRFETHDVFSQIVEDDRNEFHHYLTQLGLVSDTTASSHWMCSPLVAFLLVAAMMCGAYAVARRWNRESAGCVITTAVVGFAATFLLQSFTFPHATESGPATIPRLYVAAVAIVSVVVISLKHPTNDRTARRVKSNKRMLGTWELILAMLCYWLATLLAGYLLATAVFLVFVMYRSGVRNLAALGGATSVWLVASYVIFSRALHVPLPVGFLWE